MNKSEASKKLGTKGTSKATKTAAAKALAPKKGSSKK